MVLWKMQKLILKFGGSKQGDLPWNEHKNVIQEREMTSKSARAFVDYMAMEKNLDNFIGSLDGGGCGDKSSHGRRRIMLKKIHSMDSHTVWKHTALLFFFNTNSGLEVWVIIDMMPPQIWVVIGFLCLSSWPQILHQKYMFLL